jgi:hypothetical protein
MARRRKPVIKEEQPVEDTEIVIEQPISEPLPIAAPTPEDMAEIERKLHQSRASLPDYERIAKVLYMYLEEIDTADKQYYKDHSLVRGMARNIAAKRLKWGQRVNGELVWKV